MTDGLGCAPGDVLGGRYRLDAVLGQGGMSVVWRATDLRLDRAVAVKVFRAELAEAVDPQRTARESQLLAGVHHPAVVGALDASGSDAPVRFLVLELVEGADLKTLLGRGAIDPDLARRVMADVADALALLHGRGVVHRDVKPANILVVDEREQHRTGITAKLTDFGIAQAVDATRITSSDLILGTAAYLSPEQVRGDPVGAPSDVYSAGLVLAECLSGRRAFPGPPSEAAVARLSAAPPVPAEASPELAGLIAAMTDMEPAERPAASAVAATLRDLAGAMTLPEAADTASLPALAPSLLAAAPAPAVAEAVDEPFDAPFDLEPADAVATRRRPLLVPAIAAVTVGLLGGLGALLSAPLLLDTGPVPHRVAAPATSAAVVPPGDAVSAAGPAPTTTPATTPTRSSRPPRPGPGAAAQGGSDSTGSGSTGSGSTSSGTSPTTSSSSASSSPSSSAPASSSPTASSTATSTPTDTPAPTPTATSAPTPSDTPSDTATPAPTIQATSDAPQPTDAASPEATG